MFGASIFQSPDSSLAAATVVLLPVLLVAFTIYSQSPDLQSGRLPELSASSASSASSPAPSVVTGNFRGFFWGERTTEFDDLNRKAVISCSQCLLFGKLVPSVVRHWNKQRLSRPS